MTKQFFDGLSSESLPNDSKSHENSPKMEK